MDDKGIHDEATVRKDPHGSNRGHRRASVQMEGAVVRNAYPHMTAGLLLLFALVCAKVGLVAIAPGILFFGLIWSSRAVRSAWGIDAPVQVSAAPDGLTINGKLRLRSSALRGGFVVPDKPRGPLVLLEREHGRPQKLRVRTVRDGRDLLRGLGLDASQRAATLQTTCGPVTIGVDGLACLGSDGRRGSSRGERQRQRGWAGGGHVHNIKDRLAF